MKQQDENNMNDTQTDQGGWSPSLSSRRACSPAICTLQFHFQLSRSTLSLVQLRRARSYMQSLSLLWLCNKNLVLHQNNLTVTSPGSGNGSSATAVEVLLTVHTLTCKPQVSLAFHNLSLSAPLPLTTYTHRSIHRHNGAVGDRPHDLHVCFLSVMFNFGWQCFGSPVISWYAPPVGLCSCLSDYPDLSHLSCSLFPGRLSWFLCEHPSRISCFGVLFVPDLLWVFDHFRLYLPWFVNRVDLYWFL